MTKNELLDKIKGLGDIEESAKREVVCALIGHSKIVDMCFGYVTCARCGAQIADKLGGSGYDDAPNCVVVGHNCETCRANYEKMDWQDKIFCPDPFTDEEG